MKNKIIKLSIFTVVIIILAGFLYEKFFVIESNIDFLTSRKEETQRKENSQKTNNNKLSKEINKRSLTDQLNILKKCINLKGIDELKLHTDITSVIKEMYAKDEYYSICSEVDLKLLTYCNDCKLLDIVISAFMNFKNYNGAAKICEQIIYSKDSSYKLKNYSKTVLKNITIKKIEILIADKDYDNAFSTYNILKSKFKGDTEVLVIGAEILIKMGDWSGAEYLLNEIRNEGRYKAQINRIKKKIETLKSIDQQKEKKYDVHSVPYSAEGNSICVNAIVNDYMEQEFILDTGASMTSIPPDSLENLGVHVPFDAPIKKVKTAGGIIFAREIEIKSINLNGFEVKNLKVLDLQLPGEPSKGLLGMNFLKHFQMQINHSEKVLIFSEK